ncbi:MAG: hypothetical protein IIA27_16190 [Gemmatimonadetes bacterium]|nr:hypothetical protein [Gemmatimonadota bacterium]
MAGLPVLVVKTGSALPGIYAQVYLVIAPSSVATALKVTSVLPATRVAVMPSTVGENWVRILAVPLSSTTTMVNCCSTAATATGSLGATSTVRLCTGLPAAPGAV